MNSPNKCPCQSGLSYKECCRPLLENEQAASSPDALMRSRYTAYAIKNYQYVLATYAPSHRPAMTEQELAQSNLNTQWLALQVVDSSHSDNVGSVVFNAYYTEQGKLYQLSEQSNFNQIDGHWYYVDGDILPESGKVKLKRNLACFCGSGKKVKHCCGKPFL